MSNANDFVIVETELSWRKSAAWLYTDGIFPVWADMEGKVLLHYSGNSKHVVIPEGVREIGDKAFYKNNSIESVVVPQSGYDPGLQAFCGCKNLKLLIFEGTIHVWPDPNFIDKKSTTIILFKGNPIGDVSPASLEPKALEGFVYAFEQEIILEKNIFDANIAYLKRRRKKIYLDAVMNLSLLRLLLSEKLVPVKEIEELLSISAEAGNAEASAMILDYANSETKSKK